MGVPSRVCEKDSVVLGVFVGACAVSDVHVCVVALT